MPRTSFIEKSRKHNFHLKGTRKKSATQETLLIALRHLIRVVKATNSKTNMEVEICRISGRKLQTKILFLLE